MSASGVKWDVTKTATKENHYRNDPHVIVVWVQKCLIQVAHWHIVQWHRHFLCLHFAVQKFLFALFLVFLDQHLHHHKGILVTHQLVVILQGEKYPTLGCVSRYISYLLQGNKYTSSCGICYAYNKVWYLCLKFFSSSSTSPSCVLESVQLFVVLTRCCSCGYQKFHCGRYGVSMEHSTSTVSDGFNHTSWPQNSVLVTIKRAAKKDRPVVHWNEKHEWLRNDYSYSTCNNFWFQWSYYRRIMAETDGKLWEMS